MNWKSKYLLNLVILIAVSLWALYLIIGLPCGAGWRLLMVLVVNVVSELGRRWIAHYLGDSE